MTLPLSRPQLAMLIYVFVHVVAQLSASLFEVAPGVSLWYPPAGLALGLVVLVGSRAIPVVFAANVTGALITSGLSTWWAPWLFPAVITANYAAAGLIVRRFHGSRLLPGSVKETVWFALAVLGSPLLVALLGSLLLRGIGLIESGAFQNNLVRWWVGDAVGILTVLPVMVVFLEPWLTRRVAAQRNESTASLGEVILQMAALGGSLWLMFALEPMARPHALYLGFLPLIWIALRHGLPGATVATLALTMGSLLGLQVAEDPHISVIGCLLFETTLSVVGLGLGSAVSRRNEAEDRLSASEARLERVLTGSQAGLWDWNRATDELILNQRCTEMLGCRQDGLKPQWSSWIAMINPADREAFQRTLQAHLAGHAPAIDFTYRLNARDGRTRWMHTRGAVVARTRDGRPYLISGTHHDVTEHKRAELQAERLRQILEVTTDFVVTIDSAGGLLWCNSALLRLLGSPEGPMPIGRPLRELFPATTAEFIVQEVIPAALGGHIWQGELAVRDAAGHDFPTLLVALQHRNGDERDATVSLVFRDISRVREAEAENLLNQRRLQEVQRAESLGVLAGGIAHDFNNLLSAILGSANLVRLALPAEAPAQQRLADIETTVGRAAELCQQMLAYAGRAPLLLSEIDVGTLVEETAQLLRVSIPRKATLELRVNRPLPTVRATPAQIQQVIMNLVLNAAEAIGDRPGTIRVTTSHALLDTHALSAQYQAPTLPAGDYVVLEVEDDGPGIAPEAQTRVFEPFYTTKFAGHGLGLAAVLGIARAHGGTANVVSQLGRGSTFRLLLPAHLTGGPSLRTSARPTEEGWQGAGLALVADDDDAVRHTAGELMQSLGFEVIEAKDGQEAVEQFRKHAAELRVVLLDLTMPRVSGEEALIGMRAIDPVIPILLMSGFSDQLDSKRLHQLRPAGLLGKPFHRRGLMNQVRAALERGGKADGGSTPNDAAR